MIYAGKSLDNTIEELKKIYNEKEAKFYIDVLTNDVKFIVEKYKNDYEYDNLFFCQSGPKFAWNYEASILVKRGYPTIKDSLEKMFEWIQDLNWPGANIIVNFLLLLPQNEFNKYYYNAMNKADNSNDEEWKYNLELSFGRRIKKDEKWK